MYIKNPNLPNRKCKKIIVNKKLDIITSSILKNKNIELIKSDNNLSVQRDLAYHPDLQICHLGDNNFVVSIENYNYYKNLLPDAKLIEGETKLYFKYPNDCYYNSVFVGKNLICNIKCTDINILEYAKINNYQIINVNQGYTKCSVLPLNENSVLTSDIGIKDTLEKNNFNVFYIDAKQIYLDGYNNGFIGGCGFMLSKEELFICGNISETKEFKELIKFLNSLNIKLLYIEKIPLMDYGSFIAIE